VVATLVFGDANPSSNQTTASANGDVATSFPGRVIFTSDATTQCRMYFTQNVFGQWEIPFIAFNFG
tara:strand:- start:2572 stop:2769 length:198 start_codon:yes stop_codon:yes gene_type:complete